MLKLKISVSKNRNDTEMVLKQKICFQPISSNVFEITFVCIDNLLLEVRYIYFTNRHILDLKCLIEDYL